jgi:hypothetical protein
MLVILVGSMDKGSFESATLIQIRNSNIEIRNNVQILKIQMTQTVKIQLTLFRTLEHSYFEFVSCFVLRISNFFVLHIRVFYLPCCLPKTMHPLPPPKVEPMAIPAIRDSFFTGANL